MGVSLERIVEFWWAVIGLLVPEVFEIGVLEILVQLGADSVLVLGGFELLGQSRDLSLELLVLGL